MVPKHIWAVDVVLSTFPGAQVGVAAPAIDGVAIGTRSAVDAAATTIILLTLWRGVQRARTRFEFGFFNGSTT